MTDTPNRPPLWREMQRRADAAMASYHPSVTDEQLLAAEILALRDWLVPEEEAYKPVFPSLSDNPLDLIMASQLGQRRQLRSILTAEAERAERGE
jgi:hypothetical protein